eukprot:5335721-Alexandrium_andersonii.AAC.1
MSASSISTPAAGSTPSTASAASLWSSSSLGGDLPRGRKPPCRGPASSAEAPISTDPREHAGPQYHEG